MAINNPVIADADIIQDTAVAIQEKDHGGKMEHPDFPSRIRALPTQDNALLNSLINRSITSIENSEVTYIGNNAFSNCTKLTNVSFPNATIISANAFNNCSKLTSVILGARAILTNSNSFSGADNAITYVQPEDLSWYSTATNWSALYTAGRVKSIEELPT